MLVLSRKLNEKILVPSIQTTIQVVDIQANRVRIGIDAPRDVAVVREELPDRAKEWGPSAAPATPVADDAKLRRFKQLTDARLRVASVGLDVLRQQMQAGQIEAASATLQSLDEDLRMLRERLAKDGEVPPVAARPPSPARARKALLVEDNRNERELLAGFLRRAGFDVDTAGDGADALDYLNTHAQPDVVLMDMSMPRCDGPTTVRHIRRDPLCAGVKIFAVSGHLPSEYDLVQGPGGFDRWFHKPIDPDELLHDLCHEWDGAIR